MSADQRVRLDFPAGALNSPTGIRVTPTTVSLPGVLSGTAYAFAPDGLSFAQPVKVTLHPPSTVTLSPQESRIARIEGNDVLFDDNPTVDTQAQTISATLGGFSTHAVVSTVTLCPNGCPSVPSVVATALPDNGGLIRLTGSCSANGGGTTQDLIIERAFVEGLSSVISEFQNWQRVANILAPPSTVEGGCAYQYDDHAICLGWTYAYRVRAHSIRTTTNASNIALAIGPGSNVCTPTGGTDGGTGGGTGPGTVIVHTYTQAGSQQAVPANAAWVGGQDGAGAFAPLAGQNGVYSFDVRDASGRYGVAVACTLQTPPTAQIIQASRVEGTELHLVCPAPIPSRTSVSVQLRSCQSAGFAFGSANSAVVNCGGTTSYMFPAGTYDAIGVSYNNVSGFDRVLIERGVSAPALTLDFAGAGSAVPDSHRVNVSDVGIWFSAYITSAGLFIYSPRPGPGSYPGFPAAVRGASDITTLCTVDMNNRYRTGYICHLFKDAIDIDDSHGAYAAIPIVTAGDKTHIAWDPYLASGFEVDIASYSIWVSIGWLGQTNSYAYPRLCGLAGFPVPCIDTTTDTQYSFRAFKPAGGFAASLVDIQNAESLPPVARDGLTYAHARFIGSL